MFEKKYCTEKIRCTANRLILLLSLLMFFSLLGSSAEVAAKETSPWFEIHVVDAATGKGIPMVELYRSGLVRLVTDSNGYVAINDPDFMNQTVYFDVVCDGYDPPSDNAWLPGAVLDIAPGGSAVIKLTRNSIAQRAYRITGSAVYKDSFILGKDYPVKSPLLNADVANHNIFSMKKGSMTGPLPSGQNIVYKGKIYWFFNGLRGVKYNETNNKVAAAVSELPVKSGLSPELGINLDYITSDDGFPKEMAPFGDSGDIVFFDSVIVVKDGSDKTCLAAHYIVMDHTNTQKEHGLAVFNDDKLVFEKDTVFDMDEKWRFPRGSTYMLNDFDESEWIYMGETFPTVRVPATIEALRDPSAYEAWTCLEKADSLNVVRDEEGKLLYRWTNSAPPLTPGEEKKLLNRKRIEDSERSFLPKDKDGRIIEMKSGTVYWNKWREKWVFIGIEENGQPTRYGQVWYSEAKDPLGPWEKAIKLIEHSEHSFLNPTYLSILDQAEGRVVYFQGLITKEQAPRQVDLSLYEGNHIMYRLELNNKEIEDFFGSMDKEITEIETYEPVKEATPDKSMKKEVDGTTDSKPGVLLWVIPIIAVLLAAVAYSVYRKH